jgi:hypothetical protein
MGGRHAALVSVRKTESQPEHFEVLLHDDALRNLVPEGVVCFSNGEEQNMLLSPARAELLHSIKLAVSRYI